MGRHPEIAGARQGAIAHFLLQAWLADRLDPEAALPPPTGRPSGQGTGVADLKFKVSDDVEAPIDWVWAGFTDFAAIEADIRARDADLCAWATGRRPRLAWPGAARSRCAARSGRSRPASRPSSPRKQLGRKPDRRHELHLRGDLRPLSAEVTRVSVTLELKASTLSARLLLQTLKIARRKVIQRLEGAVVRQGQAVEADWRARAGT
jgi:hypothetical protein